MDHELAGCTSVNRTYRWRCTCGATASTAAPTWNHAYKSYLLDHLRWMDQDLPL